jgi:hypothetical protein
MQGRIDIVKLLIKNNANVNDRDEKGYTPLLLGNQKYCLFLNYFVKINF